VLVHRRGEGDPPVQVRGTVARAEEDAVVLDVDGEAVRVPYAEIVTAKQTLPW
jgi:ribosome maturation factor RimP